MQIDANSRIAVDQQMGGQRAGAFKAFATLATRKLSAAAAAAVPIG